MEEHPRNGQSRNTSVPRINEEYITQISEEIEDRITKKLSQEFNLIESRISDALSKLDEFLSNQQIQTHSKTVPGTFRNTNVENQGTNEDDSQSDPHPEAGIFRGQTTQNSGPKYCRDNTLYGVPNIWDGELGRRSPVMYNCYVSKYRDMSVTNDLYLGSPYSVNAVSFLNCDLNHNYGGFMCLL